jgi:hypothetical protein
MPLTEGWNVHTPMGANTWYPLATVEPSVDEQTLLASITLPVVFRGSRAQLQAAFKYGTPAAAALSTYGVPAGMFCLGPSNARQIDYTEAKQHWLLDVTWVGVANASGNAGNLMAFAGLVEWTRRETAFPQQIQNDDGTISWLAAGPPYTPSSPHPVTLKSWPGRRLDFVPVVNVRFVMVSALPPYPSHPAFMPVLPWLKSIPLADLADYSRLPTRTFVTWKGGFGGGQSALATESAFPANAGQWCMASITNQRRITPLSNYASTSSVWTGTAVIDYQPLRQSGASG